MLLQCLLLLSVFVCLPVRNIYNKYNYQGKKKLFFFILLTDDEIILLQRLYILLTSNKRSTALVSTLDPEGFIRNELIKHRENDIGITLKIKSDSSLYAKSIYELVVYLDYEVYVTLNPSSSYFFISFAFRHYLLIFYTTDF